MNVKISFNVNKILASRGLGSSKDVQKYLASEIVRLSDPYTPMQQGDLKNRRTIAADGSEIVYTQPYAHYQYYGEVMAGRPPKKYTGKALTYSGSPLRGARWVERMYADKRKEIENNVEQFIKRRG